MKKSLPVVFLALILFVTATSFGATWTVYRPYGWCSGGAAAPPPPAGATAGGSSDTDLSTDPTPKSWFTNVLDQDTIRIPFEIMGECKGQAIIDKVELSFDGGQSWVETNLDPKTNTWAFSVTTPMSSDGTYLLMTRATDKNSRIESSVNPNIDIRYRKKSTIVTFVNPGSDNQ